MINIMLFFPADKVHTKNVVFFVCIKVQCLIKELGIGCNGEQNKTYRAINFSNHII